MKVLATMKMSTDVAKKEKMGKESLALQIKQYTHGHAHTRTHTFIRNEQQNGFMPTSSHFSDRNLWVKLKKQAIYFSLKYVLYLADPNKVIDFISTHGH